MKKDWSWIVWVMLVLGFLYASTPVISCPLLWSYSIDGITAVSVSENGDFIAVGCQDGWFYIFDTFGNLLGSGHGTDTVVSLDITNTGDLLIGYASEYKFCTRDGVEVSKFQSTPVRTVSMSSNGTLSLVCCQNNIFINQENSMIQQVGQLSDSPVGSVSLNGKTACVASDTSLHIIVNDSNDNDLNWKTHNTNEEIKNLFVSKNGQKITFSTPRGIGYIDMETEVAPLIDMGVSIQEMTATPTGDITVFSTSGGLIWCEKGIVLNEFVVDGHIDFLSLYDNGSVAIIGKEGGIVELVTIEGTSLFTYDFESDIIAMNVCEKENFLTICTRDSIYMFQLFQKIQLNNHFIPIASRKSLPLDSPLKEVWSIPVAEDAYFVTADVDGDGLTEIVLKEGSVLKLIDGGGNQKSVKDLGIHFNIYHLFDVDGDTISEIPLILNSTEFIFSVYHWGEESPREYYLGSLGGDTPLHDAQVMPLAVLDSGDGSCEIIGEAAVGYSCKPRGTISVDYETGDINWFYQTKGSPMSRAITDINGDGITDIVVGRMAPCTCPEDEEYPDCEIYVTALSGTGEELWHIYLESGFGRVEICAEDIDECDGVEVIGFGYEASERWGSLFVLNCFGEYLYSHVYDYSIVPGAVGDIDADGLKEIVTVDTRGVLTVFTSDLQEKKSQFIQEGINPRAHLYVNDFNGDDYPEIVLDFDKKVWILDKDLNIMWEKEFENPLVCRVVNFSRCKNTLCVLSDKLYAYAYEEPGEIPCPLWEITERTLVEEGEQNLSTAESFYTIEEYRASKLYYEIALDKYSDLQDQEKIDYISEKITTVSILIFKQNVGIGMIFLGVFDGFLCVFLVYYWGFKRRWSRFGEGALLLSLPVLLGLFQVYHATEEYLQVFVTYSVPSLIGSGILVLRQNILGFLRTIAAILSGHKDMLVLSITESNGSYRVSVESIEEKFNPVKESREVVFPQKRKEPLVKKTEFMTGILSQYSSATIKKSLDYVEGILRETGTEIYKNFIPEDFSSILNTKFLMLEVEDTEIPWELMYADEFFAAKYAISRRIVTTEPVNVRQKSKRRGRKALVISDPLENLTGANPECGMVYKRLRQKMDAVLVEGHNASVGRIANLFGQEFDIIHYAGHVENGLVLSDGIMNPQEVKEFITGTPVVFVNGCKSEDLARAFLLGGAMGYVGTIHPVHDGSAAGIAADFYDFCLQYRIGEALRRARALHRDKDLVWASLIMYGDPTLKLL